MRIALAQIDPTVGDLGGNARLIIEKAHQAHVLGARLVVFPEMAVSGYPPEDLLLRTHFVAGCEAALLDIAAACPDIVAIVGVPVAHHGTLANAAAVLTGGSVAAYHYKLLIPRRGVAEDARYFTPGDRATVIGMDGICLGISIGDDSREDHGPTVAAAGDGNPQIIINLSMAPYYAGGGLQREELLANLARESNAFICCANGVGGQDELVFEGRSVVLDPTGAVVARAGQFKEELLIVDMDIAPREAAPASAHSHSGSSVQFVAVGSHETGTNAGGDLPPLPASPTIHEPLSPEAEIYAALSLGLRDYVDKNGFRQVGLGLSGGLDSALVVCIAADALGKDRVHAVSMPSRYSSEGTKNDARETAARLGIGFCEIPIERMYCSYLESLAPYVTNDDPGVTEQNIQARIRGNVLMALSNKLGWLILTCGNKSETAVGYTTLYGDMAGGFSVLKDVPKTLVYRLSRYRTALGPGPGPIPLCTIERTPSAELTDNQTDQDTLPPYDILDRIVEAHVVRQESVAEIVAEGLEQTVVEQVVAMIDGNEYKRQQAAPGVRISLKAFGKDRRLPITNRYRGTD